MFERYTNSVSKSCFLSDWVGGGLQGFPPVNNKYKFLTKLQADRRHIMVPQDRFYVLCTLVTRKHGLSKHYFLSVETLLFKCHTT